MNDSEDNLSSEDVTKIDSPTLRQKPRKRSLVERELETNLTARVTSPVSNEEGTSTSRYGRARRLKTETEHTDPKKVMVEVFKSTGPEKSPVKVQSPVYKMHASNSPIRLESPKKGPVEVYLDNQIESIYQENISLSRFGSEEKLKPSPGKKLPKIYIRKDLIQSRDPEETVILIKNIFSPKKSAQKTSNSHLSNILERSSEKFNISTIGKHSNGHIDNSSVVKTLDFDVKKKKKESKEKVLSKSDLFDMEAKCLYQVGDLAWARMGTYPFWPCIVTRDPSNSIFVKKKMFGRIERDIIHVTFFGDNGRRGWIVDNMLRKFKGLVEFESEREKFTPEDKKKDPRLYAAFFISDKKQSLWNMSVQEAEMIFKEPKRLRIDILNDMLEKARCQKTTPKTQKSGKITRNDSDVSLSESLYDTLFSEDDVKADDSDRSRNKLRNKSLDVSEVVTACLDNMAARTGITKIQRQSHMDRWLQKAKSKTPEKNHVKPTFSTKDNKNLSKQERNKKKKKRMLSKDTIKPYSLRHSTYDSQNLLAHQNEHDYSMYAPDDVETKLNSCSMNDEDGECTMSVSPKIEPLDNDKIEIDVNATYGSNHVLEAGPVDASDLVINHVKSTKPESDADNISLNETNIPYSEINLDITSDTQDSCFSTEKSTETETFDSDSQCPSNKSVTNNNTVEKDKIRDVEVATFEDDTVCMDTNDINLHKFQENSIDSRNDFDHTDDSVSSTYTDISSKMDIDMINPYEDQGIGKKESIQSLSLQLGTEVNIGSTVQSNHMDLFVSESNADEGDCKESLSIEYNTPKNCDDNVKEIDKDTSTNDTFITVDEMDGIIQDNMVCVNIINAENTNILCDKISFQHNHFIKTFHEEGASKTENKSKINTEGSPSDVENTVNTASSNDSVTEIPNKNEDSVSDLINQNVYGVDEDSREDNRAICKISEIFTDISNSLTESQHIIKDVEVNLTSAKIKTSNPHDIFNEKDPSCYESTSSNDMNEIGCHECDTDLKDGDFDIETASVCSEDRQISVTRSRLKLQLKKNRDEVSSSLKDSDFLKYLEARRDALIDEHPELGSDEIKAYLHKTWLYEESKKTDLKKSDDINHSNFVKGLDEPVRKKTSYRKTKSTEHNKKTKHSEIKKYSETPISAYSEKCSEITSKLPIVILETITPKEVNNKEVSHVNIDTIVVNNNEVEIPQMGNISKTIDHDSTFLEHEVVVKNVNSCTESNNTDNTQNKPILGPTMSSTSIEHSKCTIGVGETRLETKLKEEFNIDTASVDSEESDVPLIYSKLRLKGKAECLKSKNEDEDQHEIVADNASVSSEDSDMVLSKRRQKMRADRKADKGMEDPEFIKYLELRQDTLIDENPQLTQEEIVNYLFKTWLYEEDVKPQLKKTDDIEQSGLVKGLDDEKLQSAPKKVKKKVKSPKEITDFFGVVPREKPKRQIVKPFYNEDYYDFEDQIEFFEITKSKNEIAGENIDISNTNKPTEFTNNVVEYGKEQNEEDYVDEVEVYFMELTKPKPNIFKGLIREKVCEICEGTINLVKCKSCHGMFHIDCVKKQGEVIDIPIPTRGRKKKRKVGRRPKGSEDTESHTDDKIQDISEENIEDIEPESHTVDAEVLEVLLSTKMKEILASLAPPESYSYSSDEEMNWSDSVPGKCEIVDVKLKARATDMLDISDFKCNNCKKYDTPVCFVCKSAISKKESKMRQRCHVAHCHKYYHIDCLEHWPQTQFNAGEPSKTNKKINEHFEALTCPRHVCHTCVSDDPRGCKTRFSGDKLAKCVRCPATYHSFTKCIPAGTQILTASHIICPRHYEHSPGKVPCHVNTGWCFICALGGSLICCEYCPTSFHAECLNIDPPEGGYMCEDCETGRLPLYGEMVWVKLGHYRWWPGIILHPSEIPLNILAVKHRLGEFVVRFFGQYDYYWVNRGRVFPFQEGDSGRISSQKSKIDAAFTMAMEHAQRACEVLKSAEPNQEESLDIASSLLPPHYVKLKVNKPCGLLCGRKLDDPELSLTQCECNPDEEDPCGPYSQCLNRMLLTECGPTCRAGDRCNNRAFEKRMYPKLVPYRTPHRGWGLKTLEDIKAGQFVIEYVGELIDEEEYRRRMRRKHEIRDENFYFLTLDKERMIDAGPKGNLARFMNHCCEPNCETQKWTVLGDVRVGLFAINDIPANTEVTFNYNLECAGIEKKRCLCGAKRCSGYIGAKPKQDESQTKKGKVPTKRIYKKQKPETPPSATKPKPKKPLGRPPKPKELSEIEKDLLIIKNATNGLSSDESCRSLSSEGDRIPRTLKRKRVNFSTEENGSSSLCNGSESPSLKRQKLHEKEVGD